MSKDSDKSRRPGFTLVEVALVVVVGLSLIMSATYLFRQAKSAVSTSEARSRVLALQTMVEQLASAQGKSYPSLAQVSQLWALRRPNDYDVSPWGGLIMHGCPDSTAPDGSPNPQPPFVAGVAGVAGSGLGSDLDVPCGYDPLAAGVYATPFPAPTPAASSSEGELDYRQISNNGTVSVPDDALSGQTVTLQSYAISIRDPSGLDSLYVGAPVGQ